MAVRVGVDVGGTFTKAVACDVGTAGVVARAVVPTTHDHPDGVGRRRRASARAGRGERRARGLGPISSVAHSTTQAVNALLEGDTAAVGVLGIGRRPDLGRVAQAHRHRDHRPRPRPPARDRVLDGGRRHRRRRRPSHRGGASGALASARRRGASPSPRRSASTIRRSSRVALDVARTRRPARLRRPRADRPLRPRAAHRHRRTQRRHPAARARHGRRGRRRRARASRRTPRCS